MGKSNGNMSGKSNYRQSKRKLYQLRRTLLEREAKVRAHRQAERRKKIIKKIAILAMGAVAMGLAVWSIIL